MFPSLLLEIMLELTSLRIDDFLFRLVRRHTFADRVRKLGFEQHDELIFLLYFVVGTEDIPESEEPPWQILQEWHAFPDVLLDCRVQSADCSFFSVVE